MKQARLVARHDHTGCWRYIKIVPVTVLRAVTLSGKDQVVASFGTQLGNRLSVDQKIVVLNRL